MIAPEPALAAPMPLPGSVSRRLLPAVVAPIAAGAAVALFVLVVSARQDIEPPFGAHEGLGQLGCGVLAVAGAWGAARARAAVPAGASAAAGAVAGVVAAAGVLAAWASTVGACLLLLAAALGAALSLAVASGAAWWRIAACMVGAALPAGAAAAAALAPAGEGALLVLGALVLMAAGAAALGPVPAALRRPSAAGRWARIATWLALGGAAWWSGSALLRVAPVSWSSAIMLVAACGALAALAMARAGLALGGSLTAALLPWFAAEPAAAHERIVAAAGDVLVTYVRPSQELRLRIAGRIVDAVGPDRTEAPLALTLLHALTQPGDRVLVLGAGAGRIAEGLARVGERVFDVVDWRPGADPVRPYLSGDGPVVRPGEAPPTLAPRGRVGGPRAALAALATGSRQAIVVAEPVDGTADDPLDLQQELARVAQGGLVLQVFALDRTAAPSLHARFAAARQAHRWNGLFVVGDGAVLASGDRAFDGRRVPPLPGWADEARWFAHRAHIGDAADLQRALLGTLRPPPADVCTAPADAIGRAAALDVIRDWLQPAPEPAAGPSLLRRWSALQAELRSACAQLRALSDDAAGRAAAQALAARFLHVGAPRPELQAALGLPTPDGVTLTAPALASRCAQALDPTFFLSPPRVCASLPMPAQTASDLEDLAVLPPPARLVEIASGNDPFAVALRARFPSPCARALVAALAAGPLPAPASDALRELADPFVLREAAAVVVPRGRVRELLAFWRGDLAMPEALAALVRGGSDDRRLLASALRTRRDPSCHGVLADLMEAPEPEVRQLAAQALQHGVSEPIPYDPDGTQSARHEAAERLRSLHNRTP